MSYHSMMAIFVKIHPSIREFYIFAKMNAMIDKQSRLKIFLTDILLEMPLNMVMTS